MRRFFKDDEGSSTVEFVFFFPVFIILIFTTFEVGFLLTRYAMVERGIDTAVREVRLGNFSGTGTDGEVTYTDLRDRVCDFMIAIPDCDNRLVLNTDSYSVGDTIDLASAPCIDENASDSSFDPSDGFVYGAPSQIVLVRACVAVDPLIKNWGLSAFLTNDETGRFQIRASSAFLNEPS